MRSSDKPLVPLQMEQNMKFEGVYTPLVTPFHKDFTLNKQAMQASIDLLIDAGIDGLIVAGTEGE